MQIQEEAIKNQIKTVKDLESVPASQDGGSPGLWAVVGDAFGFVALKEDQVVGFILPPTGLPA